MKKIMCSGVKREVRAFGHGKRKERNKKKSRGIDFLAAAIHGSASILKALEEL